MLPYPSDPGELITAVCAAAYLADRIPAWAFVFRIPSTDTRFTVYATDRRRWAINGTYALTISDPDHMLLWLSADEAAFLRHSLSVVEQACMDAIAQATTGAEQPPTDDQPPPGHLNLEPTPPGYRAIANRFNEELHQVRQLSLRVDQLLPIAEADTEPDAEAGTSGGAS
jgi:hypothetical protein